MVICAVINCGNRSARDKGKRFFRFPKLLTHLGVQELDLSKRRRVAWLASLKRKELSLQQDLNIRVCSDHFVSGSPATLFDSTNPDWAPSLKLGYQEDGGGSCSTRSSTRSAGQVSARHSRAVSRSRKRTIVEVDAEPEPEIPELEIETATELSEIAETPAGCSTQTDLTMANIDEMRHRDEILQEQIDSLKDSNEQLIETVKKLKKEVDDSLMDEANFKDNDEKVLYYTGLSSWELLEKLFNYIKCSLKQQSALTPFQQLLLTLIRLRLNLSGKDLAYRFKIHESTVCRLFEFVVNLLFVKLKYLIKWPSRDVLLKTMPMMFRKHCPRCVVIIDCFEIFIDRPTNLLARAQTYSQYKHHNTVKYLIGITPQGTVSFISDGWGGRTSDKYITEHCSLLRNLVPGDTVLADRGFDITDSVGFYCSTLKTPAFTMGRSQLTAIEVEQTRRIANVRIHVERVIGNIRKKYSLLSATQPIHFLIAPDASVSLLDKMVHVCCALINMCESVVPFD